MTPRRLWNGKNYKVGLIEVQPNLFKLKNPLGIISVAEIHERNDESHETIVTNQCN